MPDLVKESTPELHWVRPPRQARSQRTLDRILDAAEALVAEKGFEDATVAEVVRRAGSSVGAFYSRFQDKEGLLYALYERYHEEAVATANVALDPARWEGRGASEILYHGDAGFRARQDRLSHHVSDRLSALLLARRSEIHRPDPERAAPFALMLAVSAIESAILFGELRSSELSLSDSELAAELIHACLAYLCIAPEPEHSTT
jgi:AcrR family transcriptional regulator